VAVASPGAAALAGIHLRRAECAAVAPGAVHLYAPCTRGAHHDIPIQDSSVWLGTNLDLLTAFCVQDTANEAWCSVTGYQHGAHTLPHSADVAPSTALNATEYTTMIAALVTSVLDADTMMRSPPLQPTHCCRQPNTPSDMGRRPARWTLLFKTSPHISSNSQTLWIHVVPTCVSMSNLAMHLQINKAAVQILPARTYITLSIKDSSAAQCRCGCQRWLGLR
jgi:hypothetical protein